MDELSMLKAEVFDIIVQIENLVALRQEKIQKIIELQQRQNQFPIKEEPKPN